MMGYSLGKNEKKEKTKKQKELETFEEYMNEEEEVERLNRSVKYFSALKKRISQRRVIFASPFGDKVVIKHFNSLLYVKKSEEGEGFEKTWFKNLWIMNVRDVQFGVEHIVISTFDGLLFGMESNTMGQLAFPKIHKWVRNPNRMIEIYGLDDMSCGQYCTFVVGNHCGPNRGEGVYVCGSGDNVGVESDVSETFKTVEFRYGVTISNVRCIESSTLFWGRESSNYVVFACGKVGKTNYETPVEVMGLNVWGDSAHRGLLFCVGMLKDSSMVSFFEVVHECVMDGTTFCPQQRNVMMNFGEIEDVRMHRVSTQNLKNVVFKCCDNSSFDSTILCQRRTFWCYARDETTLLYFDARCEPLELSYDIDRDSYGNGEEILTIYPLNGAESIVKDVNCENGLVVAVRPVFEELFVHFVGGGVEMVAKCSCVSIDCYGNDILHGCEMIHELKKIVDVTKEDSKKMIVRHLLNPFQTGLLCGIPGTGKTVLIPNLLHLAKSEGERFLSRGILILPNNYTIEQCFQYLERLIPKTIEKILGCEKKRWDLTVGMSTMKKKKRGGVLWYNYKEIDLLLTNSDTLSLYINDPQNVEKLKGRLVVADEAHMSGDAEKMLLSLKDELGISVVYATATPEGLGYMVEKLQGNVFHLFSEEARKRWDNVEEYFVDSPPLEEFWNPRSKPLKKYEEEVRWYVKQEMYHAILKLTSDFCFELIMGSEEVLPSVDNIDGNTKPYVILLFLQNNNVMDKFVKKLSSNKYSVLNKKTRDLLNAKRLKIVKLNSQSKSKSDVINLGKTEHVDKMKEFVIVVCTDIAVASVTINGVAWLVDTCVETKYNGVGEGAVIISSSLRSLTKAVQTRGRAARRLMTVMVDGEEKTLKTRLVRPFPMEMSVGVPISNGIVSQLSSLTGKYKMTLGMRGGEMRALALFDQFEKLKLAPSGRISFALNYLRFQGYVNMTGEDEGTVTLDKMIECDRRVHGHEPTYVTVLRNSSPSNDAKLSLLELMFHYFSRMMILLWKNEDKLELKNLTLQEMMRVYKLVGRLESGLEEKGCTSMERFRIHEFSQQFVFLVYIILEGWKKSELYTWDKGWNEFKPEYMMNPDEKLDNRLHKMWMNVKELCEIEA